MENGYLRAIGQRIASAYEELGHTQGWSFLYTPGRTLSSEARFLFMGLNPGGVNESDAAELTTEGGNAYNPEVEDWGNDGTGNPLQKQIVQFYQLLANKTGKDCRKLMDSTLAANFCPFRSSSWATLGQPGKSVKFCENLWADILRETQITTIVCMTSLVAHFLTSIIINSCGQIVANDSKEVGWGKVTYQIADFTMSGRDICMVTLPHLSRYQIFGRDGSAKQVEEITTRVAGSLSGWEP